MKKWLLYPLIIFVSISFFSPSRLFSAEPFPPFSVEGNPDDNYQYDEIFSLFHYINPPHFQIYENLDLTRNYEDYEMCRFAGFDRRDYSCSYVGGKEVDRCDGGEVDVCYKGGGVAYSKRSGRTSCKPPVAISDMQPGVSYQGVCEYTQSPSINRKIKGTDFSRENQSLSNNPSPSETENSSTATLSYPKLQTEQGYYENVGNDNALTWGAHYLALDSCSQDLRRLLVLTRARQTKETKESTGQWPLGWVDWGYKTNSGKTLLAINQDLPGDLKSVGKIIVEGMDDYFLTSGNIEEPSDISLQIAYACKSFKDAALAKSSWYQSFLSTPLYPPSFRQGFVRASICVWDVCCPGPRCKANSTELDGASRGLYYDISVSRAFNATLDEIMYNYPLKQAKKILTELASINPLVRFAGSSAPEATPPRIKERLEKELKDECLDYRFDHWKSFGAMVDYVKPNSTLDQAGKCPGYKILSGQSKELAGAFPESTLQKIIDFLWNTLGGNKIDEVIPVFRHLVTVPDAMGQSLGVMMNWNYNINDTLKDIKEVEKFNQNLSNVVDDQADYLYAGKPPYTPRRHLGYFTCSDPYFSAQTKTSIEAYALGTRIGCSDTLSPGVCDGQLFGKLLQNNGDVPTEISEKANSFFKASIETSLTPELMKTYALAEEKTGVPCEVLAGIHFVEAGNNPEGSLVSGRRLGTPEPDAGGRVFKNLQETADYAGEHLLGKVGGQITDIPTLITALSRYNGGGNSNCQLGYPYPIPYGGCPKKFEGEDDPYPINWLDARHETMYLLYCADHTACEPQEWLRPGAYTVALAVYQNFTKSLGNSSFSDAAPILPPSPASSAAPLPVFAPKSCGPETLDTALGCLPYNQEFTGALLGFLTGISGAIALVIMLMGTIQIISAGGDPKKLEHGKELFKGAVIGLLVVIFSVTLLKIIASDIIKLPGF